MNRQQRRQAKIEGKEPVVNIKASDVATIKSDAATKAAHKRLDDINAQNTGETKKGENKMSTDSYITKYEVLAVFEMFGFGVKDELKEEFYNTEVKGTLTKFEWLLDKMSHEA